MVLGASLVGALAAQPLPYDDESVPLSAEFAYEVTEALHPPPETVAAYAQAMQQALAAEGRDFTQLQFVALVDRSPQVQALLLFWGRDGLWQLVGAAPVSTGQPGRYEHFETPLGVFDHSLANPDFRAEGSKNELGIRGYGRKGLRVFDFGWVKAPKGWGDGATSEMRLQMHATDPDVLEQRLGSAQSKGCVRIPAALNELLDRFGVLDADYLQAADAGRQLWVLRADRTPTAWPGRYLVVVDSLATQRPGWAPAPRRH